MEITPIQTFEEWQKNILSIIDEKPDNKTIYMRIKSPNDQKEIDFIRWLVINKPKRVFYTDSATSMKRLVWKKMQKEQMQEPFVFVISLYRQERYDNYEMLKNAIYNIGGNTIQYNTPHIFVFVKSYPPGWPMDNIRTI